MSVFVNVANAGFALWLWVAPAPTDQVLELGNRLLAAGMAEEAITEYKRYVFFNAPTGGDAVAHAYAQIAVAHRSLGRHEHAIDALLLAIQAERSPDSRDQRRIDLGIAELARGRYDLAEFALLKVEMFSASVDAQRRAVFFRGICNLYSGKWEEARLAFKKYGGSGDPASRELAARIEELLRPESGLRLKSPGRAKALSSVIPGLGEFYVGQWRGGLNALLINGAAGYVVFQSVAGRRYLEALIDSSMVLGRFYGGNRQRAATAAIRFNEQQGRRLVAQVLALLEVR